MSKDLSSDEKLALAMEALAAGMDAFAAGAQSISEQLVALRTSMTIQGHEIKATIKDIKGRTAKSAALIRRHAEEVRASGVAADRSRR